MRRALFFDLFTALGAALRGAHGAVGLDIEAASSEWLVRKLLVELAPKK